MKKIKIPSKLKEFLGKLEKIDIKDVEIPQFYIPNWPKDVEIKIELRKRDYFTLAESEETKLYELVQRRNKIEFAIYKDGSIKVTIHSWNEDSFSSSSDYYNTHASKLSRIRALLLFSQFEEEIFEEIVKKLKADQGGHNQIIGLIEKAFDPFKPFLVADKLSDSYGEE